MRMQGEVLIVGGGVAGLAAAMRLGAAGHRVLVVDKAPLPRDKVCGEGLMPMGLGALRQLGLDPTELPGASFRGVEYRTPYRRQALDLRPGQQGRGVRRTVLIQALHSATAALPGVSHHADAARQPIWERGRIVGVQGVHGSYYAPVVLAADGVHSGLAHRAGAKLRVYGERMGVRRHYRLAPGVTVPRVVMGLTAPYDLYCTPVGEGTLLATTLTDRAGYRALAERYDDFVRSGPCGDLFAGAEPISEQLGWHHPLFVPQRYNVGGALLLGDAGGGVDPCLGMGASLALATAVFAAEAARGMLEEPARRDLWVHLYERRRKILFQHFNWVGRLMRAAVRSRQGSEMLLASMRHWPAVAESLLDIVATGRTWHSFSWAALAEPLWAGWRSRRPGTQHPG